MPAILSTIRNASAIFIPSKLTLLIVILQLARNEEKKLTSMKISIGRQILHFPKKKKRDETKKDFTSKHRKRNERYQTAWWINRLTPFPWFFARSWNNKSQQAANSCLPFFPTSAFFIVCVGPAFTISKGRMLVMQKWNADEVVIAEGLGENGRNKTSR